MNWGSSNLLTILVAILVILAILYLVGVNVRVN